MHDALTRAFGPVRSSGWRGARGLRLVAPREGFNSHGCVTTGMPRTLTRCAAGTGSTFESFAAWGWKPADMFVPNASFGLHTKETDMLGEQLLGRATTC